MVTWRFFLRYSNAFIVLVTGMGLLLSSGLPSVHASTIIAFDATANNSCNASTPCGVTLSWSHTVGSGSNGILIVGVSEGAPLPSVASIVYGSSSLTFIAAQDDADEGVRAEAWYLLDPPAGTASITVTFPSSPGQAVGGSVSYFNVAGLGSSNSAGNFFPGNPASVTVNANSGDLVTDVLAMAANGATPGAGQTQRWNVLAFSTIGGGSDKPASSQVTMTWTGQGTPSWAIIGVDLQPSITGIPEYPLGLPVLAVFMIVAYGLIRRRTKNPDNV